MKKEIDTKIKELLSNSNQTDKKRIDIIELAKKNSITVGNAYLPHGEDGYLAFSNKNTDDILCIGVNMYESIEEKRYITAYIMGIYYTLFSESKDIPETYIGKIHLKSDSKDEAADYFARSLLLPTEIFEKSYEYLKENPIIENIDQALAKEYQVPLEIISSRKSDIENKKGKAFVKTK